MTAFGREPDTKWFKVWGIVGALYGTACLTSASFCTISLVRFVRRTEKRMDRFAVEGDSERKRKKTIAATRQGLLYITAQQLYLLPIIFYAIAVAILDLNLPMWAWSECLCTKNVFLCICPLADCCSLIFLWCGLVLHPSPFFLSEDSSRGK